MQPLGASSFGGRESTSVTSAATVILTDYVKPLARNTTERHHVFVLRLSSVIVGT